ncbi:hypothetical protein A2U01_0113186, partial [Trifolium medium]|nr:hypothetical protein [Trifolium medium]
MEGVIWEKDLALDSPLP